jgi:hypothetical protein
MRRYGTVALLIFSVVAAEFTQDNSAHGLPFGIAGTLPVEAKSLVADRASNIGADFGFSEKNLHRWAHLYG